MEYPITNRYMDLNAERLGKDSHCAQYVRAALQEIEEKFKLLPRGAHVGPIDFNDDVILPAHPISAGRSSVPVRVSFDAAEGDGRVWLMVSADHDADEPWIAIEGAENARELARLLNAWANGYTGGDDVKPEA